VRQHYISSDLLPLMLFPAENWAAGNSKSSWHPCQHLSWRTWVEQGKHAVLSGAAWKAKQKGYLKYLITRDSSIALDRIGLGTAKRVALALDGSESWAPWDVWIQSMTLEADQIQEQVPVAWRLVMSLYIFKWGFIGTDHQIMYRYTACLSKHNMANKLNLFLLSKYC
jgi:hypothetical protein